MRGVFGTTGRALLDGLLKWHFPGEGRIAVFGPCPQDHLDAIVECDKEVQYVDCSRGFDWRPRLDGLQLVLEDGAKAVWIASPNYPTGTPGELEKLAQVLESFPDVQLLIDQRWATSLPVTLQSNHTNILYLRKVSPSPGESAFVLCGPSLVEEDWSTEKGVSWVSEVANPEGLPGVSDMDSLAKGFDVSRYRVTHGSGEWLFVQAPGTDGLELAADLRKEGYRVDYQAVHTWRNGVCVWGKNHEN